jgi:hypothetical protein
MAALVQPFPQSASTVTMLQTRPSSASGTLQSNTQNPYQTRSTQATRNVYSSGSGGHNTSSYRGHSTGAPIAPYAFTSTPGFSNSGTSVRQNQPTPHLRAENRTSSAPSMSSNDGALRKRGSSVASLSNMPTSNSLPQQYGTKDDMALSSHSRAMPRTNVNRPFSTIALPTSWSPGSTSGSSSPNKPSPDRYRRGNSQQALQPSGSAQPSGSGMPAVAHFYQQPQGANSLPSLQTYNSKPSYSQALRYGGSSGGVIGIGAGAGGQASVVKPAFVGQQGRQNSLDDMQAYRQPKAEQAKRYRRRSFGSMDAADMANLSKDSASFANPNRPFQAGKAGSNPHTPPLSSVDRSQPKMPQANIRPSSAHGRSGSSESAKSHKSTQSRPTSSRQELPNAESDLAQNKADTKSLSTDASKRLTNPSPLSKPMAAEPESPTYPTLAEAAKKGKSSTAAVAAPSSPNKDSKAAQHLTAVNEKDKKGVKSRLRRAFSFGSAQELRRTSIENSVATSSANDRAKLRKERYVQEQEDEQARIAKKQEEGGIGESIYSGQGNFFTGSTDNLSISSTASSASMMMRKMGKGIKKSTRNLAGLFRPKSVTGVPPMDSAMGPSLAQVSMVTVEAEQEAVNVNADPHDRIGGGTGYPKLERNSLDAASLAAGDRAVSRGSHSTDTTRRSIVGGEKERAEVLAAVKRGILKRRGTGSGDSSPVTRPADARQDFALPGITNAAGSPHSSRPSTPGDNQPVGHSSVSVPYQGHDYFTSFNSLGVNPDATDSAVSTPGPKNNVNFSPRIQFHDTWTPGEYDRRGEIATCNRLTPMLAQQIKEELNTFKMVSVLAYK